MKMNSSTVLPFQRLAHITERYRWWKPLLALVLSVVFWALFSAVLIVGMIILTLVSPDNALLVASVEDNMSDMTNPWTFAFSMLTIAVMLPAVFLGVRLSGRRSVGYLSSVEGCLRWGLMWRFAPLAVLTVGLSIGGTLLMNWWNGETVKVEMGPLIALQLALVFLLAPVQSIAEEYVFRSLAMQTVGAWLKNAWWAILLPLPLFIFGHDYNWVGLLDVGFFALVAAWLTWKTGGIEAAGALHVINNCAVMAVGMLGLTDINAKEADFSLATLFLLTVPTIIYAYGALKIHARSRSASVARYDAEPDAERDSEISKYPGQQHPELTESFQGRPRLDRERQRAQQSWSS